MIKDAKNKQQTDSADKSQSEAPLEEYHFAGGGEYEPLAVQARSREEAEKLWQGKRKKVEPSQIIN